MKTVVHLGDKPVTLAMSDFDDEIDVDQLLSIDYSNLYGEAVTVSALLNKIGVMLAESEYQVKNEKFEFDIYEAEVRKKFRRSSAINSGKFEDPDGDFIKLTESSLDEAVKRDPAWKIKKKNVIGAERNFSFIDKLYWACQSKDKKLNNLIRGVSPEELYEELVEGKINSIVIKKVKFK